MKIDIKKLAQVMGEGLRDLGYAVEDAEVEQSIEDILAGKNPEGEPAFVIHYWLEKLEERLELWRRALVQQVQEDCFLLLAADKEIARLRESAANN